eukprot:2828149-Prymnesium_polylepis.1
MGSTHLATGERRTIVRQVQPNPRQSRRSPSSALHHDFCRTPLGGARLKCTAKPDLHAHLTELVVGLAASPEGPQLVLATFNVANSQVVPSLLEETLCNKDRSHNCPVVNLALGYRGTNTLAGANWGGRIFHAKIAAMLEATQLLLGMAPHADLSFVDGGDVAWADCTEGKGDNSTARALARA